MTIGQAISKREREALEAMRARLVRAKNRRKRTKR